MDLHDIFKTFHPNSEEYIFFPNSHGTFSRIYPVLGHKSKLGKCNKVQIMLSIFSDHKTMRLDINYKKTTVKKKKRKKERKKERNHCRLSNTFLSN